MLTQKSTPATGKLCVDDLITSKDVTLHHSTEVFGESLTRQLAMMMLTGEVRV